MTSLLRAWNAYQVGITIALLLAAWLLKRVFGPRIRAWMTSREGWPTWRMRILALIHRRLFIIFFVVLIWIAVLVMREVTWPSRSFLRGIVRYGAWVFVTLAILNLTDEAASILDSIGFDLGDARLSLLTLVQGVLVVAALVIIARFLTGTASSRIEKNDEMSPSMRVLAVKFL